MEKTTDIKDDKAWHTKRAIDRSTYGKQPDGQPVKQPVQQPVKQPVKQPVRQPLPPLVQPMPRGPSSSHELYNSGGLARSSLDDGQPVIQNRTLDDGQPVIMIALSANITKAPAIPKARPTVAPAALAGSGVYASYAMNKDYGHGAYPTTPQWQ